MVLLVLAQAIGAGSALAATTCADINAGAFNTTGDHQSNTTVSLTAGDVITLNYTFIVDTTFFDGIELGIGGHYADGSGTTSGTLRVTVNVTGSQSFSWRSLSEGLPSQIDVTVTCATTTAAPAVTSTSPASGPVVGRQTTIVTGKQLTGATSVKFGGLDVLAFQVLSATQISVVTPPHAAGAVDITVTTPLGSATGAALYRYTAMPDPSADPTLKAMVDFQVHTVQVMGQQQIDNVQDRLNELHNDDVPVMSNKAAIMPSDPRRPNGLPATTNPDDSMASAAAPAQAPRKPNGEQARPAMAASDSGLRYWTAGALQFGRDTSYAGAKYNVSSSGLTAGADLRPARNLKLGIAFGYGIDHATIGSDGSRIDASTWSTQIYASYRAAPHWFVDGVLGYAAGTLGNYRYDTSALAIGSGNRAASDVFGSLAVIREFELNGYKIAPYARLDMQSIRLGSYAETGAGIYNLSFRQTSAFDLAGMVGTKFSHAMDTRAGVLKSSFELGYRHGFSGAYTQIVSYTIDAATTYGLLGTAEKRDHALIGLGLELQVNRSLGFGLQFDELIANQARSERARARVKLAF